MGFINSISEKIQHSKAWLTPKKRVVYCSPDALRRVSGELSTFFQEKAEQYAGQLETVQSFAIVGNLVCVLEARILLYQDYNKHAQKTYQITDEQCLEFCGSYGTTNVQISPITDKGKAFARSLSFKSWRALSDFSLAVTPKDDVVYGAIQEIIDATSKKASIAWQGDGQEGIDFEVLEFR